VHLTLTWAVHPIHFLYIVRPTQTPRWTVATDTLYRSPEPPRPAQCIPPFSVFGASNLDPGSASHPFPV
jgi:hypothetical protein